MMLRDLAHVRTGDKGNISQISVIAYRPGDFPLLAREVTVERVVAALRGLRIAAARRYELADLGALNFVLEGALGGGVTRSLALDAHGKTLGAQILAIEIDAERGR
jgi:hypothetical protein